MSRPRRDESYITIVASAFEPGVTADGIERLLDEYPGTDDLRTDPDVCRADA